MAEHDLQIIAKMGNDYNGNRPTAPDWTLEIFFEEACIKKILECAKGMKRG
jgi:hypothetical protein